MHQVTRTFFLLKKYSFFLCVYLRSSTRGTQLTYIDGYFSRHIYMVRFGEFYPFSNITFLLYGHKSRKCVTTLFHPNWA